MLSMSSFYPIASLSIFLIISLLSTSLTLLSLCLSLCLSVFRSYFLSTRAWYCQLLSPKIRKVFFFKMKNSVLFIFLLRRKWKRKVFHCYLQLFPCDVGRRDDERDVTWLEKAVFKRTRDFWMTSMWVTSKERHDWIKLEKGPFQAFRRSKFNSRTPIFSYYRKKKKKKKTFP